MNVVSGCAVVRCATASGDSGIHTFGAAELFSTRLMIYAAVPRIIYETVGFSEELLL